MPWIRIGKHRAYQSKKDIETIKWALANDKDYTWRIEKEENISRRDAKVGMKSPFPMWDPSHPEQYSHPITVFDTETGANHEIIALGALKVALNNITKKFETIDTYERYYQPTDLLSPSWRESLAVHGLTPRILSKLRKQQGAKYSLRYNAQEQIAFRKFFEGSILAGHNIDKADIPWALGDYLPDSTGTIDTLIAFENMRGRGGNKLDEVFKDVTGMSMERAGFGHHNALADTYATAVVLNALLTQKNDTGKSLQYILKHPYAHLSPVDNPDIFGPSQVSEGGYKSYLRSPSYYISRRNIMSNKPIDSRYDIRDPETGGLIEGYHEAKPYENELEDLAQDAVLRSLERDRDILRGTDTSKINAQFLELAKGIKASQQQLSRAITDMSGALRVNTASSRPATLRFLSKFVSDDPEFVNNQKWMDAAEALHIPTTEWSSYYKTSRDYAQKMGTVDSLSFETMKDFAGRMNRERTENYNTPERLRTAKSADRLLRYGKLTNKLYTEVIGSYDNMDVALDKAVLKTEQFTSALHKLAEVPIFDPERIINAEAQGMSHTLGAAKGILPSFMLSPANRFVDIITTMKRHNYAPLKATGNIFNALGATTPVIGSMIGTAVGGPVGGAIGGAIGGGINLVTQVVGNTVEAQTNRKWYQASSTMNMLGMGVDLLTTPLKLLRQATHLLSKEFFRFGGFIKGFLNSGLGNMSQLGNPLTTLTGVTYSNYQGLELAEGALGLGKGTLNSMANDFANQRNLLYSTGQMNQQRVIASSMLGVFSEVYGNSGSLESTINALARRKLSPGEMSLTSQINSSLPQILQIMQDLGITNVGQLKNPGIRGMYFNPITGPGESGRTIWDSSSRRRVDERTAFRQDAYEFGAFKGSISNSLMRVVDRIWRGGGKAAANTVSGALDVFASGGSFSELVNTLKGLKVGGSTIGEWWEKIKSGIGTLWHSSLLPSLLGVVQSLGNIYLTGIDKLINSLAPLINTGINTLLNTKVKGNLVNGFYLEVQKGGIQDFTADVKWAPGWEHQVRSGPITAEDYLEDFRTGKLDAITFKDKKGRVQLFDARGKSEEERQRLYQQFKGSLQFLDYTDYTEGIRNTAHAATGAAKSALTELVTASPEIIEAIVGSVKQMTQEVVTTVKVELVDTTGRIRRAMGSGSSVEADGVRVSVNSMSNRRTN